MNSGNLALFEDSVKSHFLNESGSIWTHEHGPRGGDEIIENGNNYGWPVISYDIIYDGTIFTSLLEK